MVKILRARTAGKQPTVVNSTSTSQAIAVSKNVLRPTPVFKNGGRGSVRILFAPDPHGYNKLSTKTVPTFSPVVSQFSDNVNFDPSKAPGSVTVKAVSKSVQTPGKSSRGHQKVITLGRQYFKGGKTLKRH